MKFFSFVAGIMFALTSAALAQGLTEVLPEGEEPQNMVKIEMERRATARAEAEAKKAAEEEAKKLEEEKKALKQAHEEEENALMSDRERRLAKRRAEIAAERAAETSRFKKKAIENTIRREKKYEEIMQRKQEKASRFQKKAVTFLPRLLCRAGPGAVRGGTPGRLCPPSSAPSSPSGR